MEESRKRPPCCKNISRRDFIKDSSKAAAGVALSFGALEKFIPEGKRSPKVVRAFDLNATNWDYQSNYYFDYINQGRVNRMLMQGLRELTRTRSDADACESMLGGYRAGAKIAIKINLNNYANQSNEIDATAPSINALLRGLVDLRGIPAEKIYIYDCSRPIPAFRLRDRIPYNVNFVQSGDALAQSDTNSPISFRSIGTQYAPLVLTQANHLIDLCLFKDHLFVLSTMAFKNHFGTTRPGPQYLHPSIDNNLSDLNATPEIRNKTRLILADALFGVYTGGPYGNPQQWSTFPNGPTPNSLFLGFDPVATESVMVDYLIAEQEYHNINLLSHDFLRDAMEYHGLGVHEHRDVNGNYSNIDYVELDLT